MKKTFTMLLCLLLLCLCACVSTAPKDTATTKKATQGTSTEENSSISTTTTETSDPSMSTTNRRATESNLYSDILKKYYDYLDDEDGYSWARSYAFYDVDGDGTDELLFGTDKNYFQVVYLLSVYKIQNDVTVRQEAFSTDPEEEGPPLLLKNGNIRSISYCDNEVTFHYYRFEDGELKFKTMLMDNLGDYSQSNGAYSEFKRFSITEEEFDQAKKEMEGDGQTVELDWRPLAEYGR